MVKVAASVLNADFSEWKKWLPQLEEANVDRIQWDIMDNQYVSNDGVNKHFLEELRPRTKIFFESHLMVLHPENYIKEFAELGNQLLIFHIETSHEPLELIKKIEDSGMKTGVAVNNKTSVEKIFPILDKVDLALVMSVEAGFGGQKFNHLSLEKISSLRKKVDEEGLKCAIEVDGGVNIETGKKCVQAGIDVLAVGTGVFKHEKGIVEAVKELHDL